MGKGGGKSLVMALNGETCIKIKHFIISCTLFALKLNILLFHVHYLCTLQIITKIMEFQP